MVIKYEKLIIHPHTDESLGRLDITQRRWQFKEYFVSSSIREVHYLRFPFECEETRRYQQISASAWKGIISDAELRQWIFDEMTDIGLTHGNFIDENDRPMQHLLFQFRYPDEMMRFRLTWL